MNTGKWGLLGGGALIALVFAAGAFIGVGGMAVAHHDVKETAKPISAWDIVDKLDGKEAKATVVEVTLGPESLAFEYARQAGDHSPTEQTVIPARP